MRANIASTGVKPISSEAPVDVYKKKILKLFESFEMGIICPILIKKTLSHIARYNYEALKINLIFNKNIGIS